MVDTFRRVLPFPLVMIVMILFSAACTPVTAPSDTPEPAEAAAVLPGIAAPDVAGYCLPTEASDTNIQDPLTPPSLAQKVKKTENSLEVSDLPADGCVFYYTFTGKAPGDLKLEVSEPNQLKPFLRVDLKPVEGNPETLWGLVRHAMIISPMTERLTVNFTVRDPLGQVVRQDVVNLRSRVDGTQGPDDPDDDEDCGCDVGDS